MPQLTTLCSCNNSAHCAPLFARRRNENSIPPPPSQTRLSQSPLQPPNPNRCRKPQTRAHAAQTAPPIASSVPRCSTRSIFKQNKRPPISPAAANCKRALPLAMRATAAGNSTRMRGRGCGKGGLLQAGRGGADGVRRGSGASALLRRSFAAQEGDDIGPVAVDGELEGSPSVAVLQGDA